MADVIKRGVGWMWRDLRSGRGGVYIDKGIKTIQYS